MARHDKVTEDERREWTKMALEGVPVEDIAKQAGRNPITVYRHLWDGRVAFQYRCRGAA